MDFFLTNQEQIRVLASVALAMVLGAMIGLERELENKPAGLRTHMLVTGAAAFFVLLSNVIVAQFKTGLGEQTVSADPIRTIEAVVTGISFLGGGTILVHRNVKGDAERKVEGLTTAASVLFSAAIGVSVALSQVILAVGVTVLTLVTLRLLGLLEERLERRRQEQECRNAAD